MKFSVKKPKSSQRPSPTHPGQVFLYADNWDDYSFKTSFDVVMLDSSGKPIELGTVKIGFVGQSDGWTCDRMDPEFGALSSNFFSLGQDVKYYKAIHDKLDPEARDQLLRGLQDVVNNAEAFARAREQSVFRTSLTRSVSASTARDQFRRVLNGQPELTDFHFRFRQEASKRFAPIELDFQVTANSTPSTNVHVLIGRNGVGKTTLLNSMATTLMGQQPAHGDPSRQFSELSPPAGEAPLPTDYFSSVVSVSFSAFDPFLPPKDRQDRTEGPGFFYVGLKSARVGAPDGREAPPKTSSDLVRDFVASFTSCISQPAKRNRWLRAVRRLESDSNFAAMSLGELLELDAESAPLAAKRLAGRLSSGHSIVLLTITRLVDTVDEKTLVLLDEPESHLHPPLLSAFTRALSDLLHDQNGVAIVATHSPVVLQEVPRSCVWKLTRVGADGRSDRPERETFGENVGVLTREVFGLEVSKSGFHEMLERAVDANGTFESILETYNEQLGTEARAILLSLIASRDAT